MFTRTIIPLLATALLSCGQKNSPDSGNDKAANAFAATQEEISISDLKPASENYTFPVVHFSNNKIAEEKVNTFLQLEQLEHLPGVFEKNPFENIMPRNGTYSGTTSFYSWERHTTVPSVLSLSQEAEGMGAYPEGFTNHSNFDARNGNEISLKDLFTEDGLRIIAQHLNQRVKKEIEDHMKELEKSGASQDYSQEEKEEQMLMYQRCLENVTDYKTEDYSFYVSNDSIVFERDRCSNHAMRALDELDKFDIPMSFSELKKHLTPYGENLLGNNSQIAVAPTPEGKLYKGFIDGKYAISAIVSGISNDGSLTMTYWYDKKRIPIEWTGTFKDQHFSMTESEPGAETSVTTANVEADWKGNKKIQGTWTNAKTKAVLELEAQ